MTGRPFRSLVFGFFRLIRRDCNDLLPFPAACAPCCPCSGSQRSLPWPSCTWPDASVSLTSRSGRPSSRRAAGGSSLSRMSRWSCWKVRLDTHSDVLHPSLSQQQPSLVLQTSAIRSWTCIPRGTSPFLSSYRRRSGRQLLQPPHLQSPRDSLQSPTLLRHHQRRRLLREAALRASSNAHT